MTTSLFSISLGLLALGSALMSGLFFVFSNFALASLARIKPEAGMSAMQTINITIINPWFMILFFGTAIGSVGASLVAALHRGHPASPWILAGAGLYLAGCLLVTLRRNVPLNNTLAAVDPKDPASATVWKDYVAKWQPWNHVRTIATLLAAAAYLAAGRSL